MQKICKGNIEKINLLIDNQLDVLQKKEMLMHIENCPACHRFYHDMMTLKSSVTSIPLTLSADFSKSVMDAIKKQKKISMTRFTYYKVIRYAAVAVAACLVIVFSVVLLNNRLNSNQLSENAPLMMQNSKEYGVAESSDNVRGEVSKEDEDVFLMATSIADNCTIVEEYDYLLQNQTMTNEVLIERLKKEFSVTEYRIYDECLVITIDKMIYTRIIEKFNFSIIEEIDNKKEQVTIKILNNHGS